MVSSVMPWRSCSLILVSYSKKEARRDSYTNRAWLLCAGDRLLGGQAAALQQGTDFRVAAAEAAVHLHRIHGAALGQQHLAEVVAVLAQHAAVFLEPFDGVGVQLLRPQGAVVAG